MYNEITAEYQVYILEHNPDRRANINSLTVRLHVVFVLFASTLPSFGDMLGDTTRDETITEFFIACALWWIAVKGLLAKYWESFANILPYYDKVIINVVATNTVYIPVVFVYMCDTRLAFAIPILFVPIGIIFAMVIRTRSLAAN